MPPCPAPASRRQPARLPPSRNHAYSCRCPECAPGGRRIEDAGAAGPWILLGFILLIIGFWPAMVWHGQIIHAIMGVAVRWGFIGFCFLLRWYAQTQVPPQNVRDQCLPVLPGTTIG
jgi:hypothetical protein